MQEKWRKYLAVEAIDMFMGTIFRSINLCSYYTYFANVQPKYALTGNLVAIVHVRI